MKTLIFLYWICDRKGTRKYMQFSLNKIKCSLFWMFQWGNCLLPYVFMLRAGQQHKVKWFELWIIRKNIEGQGIRTNWTPMCWLSFLQGQNICIGTIQRQAKYMRNCHQCKINWGIFNLTINIIHIQITNSTRMSMSVWIKQFLVTNLTIRYKHKRDKKIVMILSLNENITKFTFEKVRTYIDFTFELKYNWYCSYGQTSWCMTDCYVHHESLLRASWVTCMRHEWLLRASHNGHIRSLGHILLKTFVSGFCSG
jgi:hypothetical protein